jgi:hypothetical protein
MAPRPAPRWMTAIIDQSTQPLPGFPWERAAKRARRLNAVHPFSAPSRAYAQHWQTSAENETFHAIAAQ